MVQALDRKDKILQLIRLKGPVIPSQINKELNLDILMASAALGELADHKILNISNVKVGGAPLYYLPGQEARLQQFSTKLNEKDREAFDLLRKEMVLRDRELTPLMRVALRSIKDFAMPLNVNTQGNSEIFWKWYLLSNEEATSIIRRILAPELQKELPKKEAEKIQERQIAQEPMARQKPAQQELPIKQTAEVPFPEKKVEKPKPDVQKKLTKERPEKEDKPEKADDFMELLTKYFNANRIEVSEKKIIRKNSEAEFIVAVPSSVGMLSYYCRAKNKKKISDGDLSSAYFQGQSKKLPMLLLTTGQLTKKAKEMLQAEFKGMSVKII